MVCLIEISLTVKDCADKSIFIFDATSSSIIFLDLNWTVSINSFCILKNSFDLSSVCAKDNPIAGMAIADEAMKHALAVIARDEPAVTGARMIPYRRHHNFLIKNFSVFLKSKMETYNRNHHL